MRVHFSTTELPMRFARAVQYVFPHVKLATAQEWTAQMFAYRDWHQLAEIATNYTGQPTDVWRLATRPDDIILPDGHRVPQGGSQIERWPTGYRFRPLDDHDRYQANVIERLAGGLLTKMGALDVVGELHGYARNGSRGVAKVNLGRGQPFFESLQESWFGDEERASVVFDSEGFSDEEHDLTGYTVREGFSSLQQANRWFSNTTGNPEEVVAMMRRSLAADTVNRQFPVHVDGAYIGLQSEVPRVITQQTQRRVWIRNRRGQMTGGVTLNIILRAATDRVTHDALEFRIMNGWLTPDEMNDYAFGSLIAHALSDVPNLAVQRFIRSRVSMSEPAGRIHVPHDQRPQSIRAARELVGTLGDDMELAGFSYAGAKRYYDTTLSTVDAK